MTKKVAIILGHPDPSSDTFCHALADACVEGATAAGGTVSRFDIGELDFPVLRSSRDYVTGQAGTPADLVPAQRAIVDARHIILIYPLWHGTVPALLKAFLEQVLRPGVALEYTEQGFPKKLLVGKSARIVITMGMPVLAYRWFFGAHSLKSLERNVLGFSGIRPIRETLFGGIDAVSHDQREKWLSKMRSQARRDSR